MSQNYENLIPFKRVLHFKDFIFKNASPTRSERKYSSALCLDWLTRFAFFMGASSYKPGNNIWNIHPFFCEKRGNNNVCWLACFPQLESLHVTMPRNCGLQNRIIKPKTYGAIWIRWWPDAKANNKAACDLLQTITASQRDEMQKPEK